LLVCVVTGATVNDLKDFLKSSFLVGLRAVETKGERTRQGILAAAIVRFGRDGFRATSVADIARDAGVGGTVAYAYFPGKEALFLAAVDEDAAGVIEEGLASIAATLDDWHQTLMATLVAALDRHPLARRLLAGLEPDVTDRVLEIPALAELRKAVAERLRSEQAAGTVRTDIDAASVASGLVTLVLSLLMSTVQVGGDAVGRYAPDVIAVFDAAIGVTRPSGKASRRRR
jgi:AcrR family transcriptional regulator